MSIATTVSDVLTVNPTAHAVDLQGLRTGLHRRLTSAGDVGFGTRVCDRAGGSGAPHRSGLRCPRGGGRRSRDATGQRLGRLMRPAEHPTLRASGLSLT